MNPGETPPETAAREFREESGFDGPLTLVPGSEWIHQVKLFGLFHLYTFHNYIGVVETQFEPSVPNHEVEAARWMTLEEVDALPGSSLLHASRGSIHFGLRQYLAQKEVRMLLQQLCSETQSSAAGTDAPAS